MSTVKCLYLSGSMTGHADHNFPAFHDAELELCSRYEVVSPARMGLEPDMEWADYLRRDLMAMLDGADGVALLPGWESSRGARLEVAVAVALGMPVAPVADWLAGEPDATQRFDVASGAWRPATEVDTNAVVDLGALALAFGRVDRITYHPDGTTRESDTDHTVMLGLVACAFAAEHLPHLDLGLIAQFALVHDLVEVYAGDTPTLRIDDAGRASKAGREEAALARLAAEFDESLPWLVTTIDRYEQRRDAEARYVKALDKLLPKVTHILNGGVTLREQGMDEAELLARYAAQLDELMSYASDFPPLFELRDQLVASMLARMGG